jgi:glutathione S-transferase
MDKPNDSELRAHRPTLVGRSSSHFTRVVRIFARELSVDYTFRVVRDLLSTEPADYAGNPALRLPALETAEGVWFGSLNSCRALARLAERKLDIAWPEQLVSPVLANAQELTLQAMATEVALIMAKASGGSETAHLTKLRRSLENMLLWLDTQLPAIERELPTRELNYLEVTLFCLVTHLPFREIQPNAELGELKRFAAQFGERPSARSTQYRFDT